MKKTRGIREILADNLKKRRKGAGWSQLHLEKLSGVSKSNISRIEKADMGTTVDMLEKLARALPDCAAFELLLDDNDDSWTRLLRRLRPS